MLLCIAERDRQTDDHRDSVLPPLFVRKPLLYGQSSGGPSQIEAGSNPLLVCMMARLHRSAAFELQRMESLIPDLMKLRDKQRQFTHGVLDLLDNVTATLQQSCQGLGSECGGAGAGQDGKSAVAGETHKAGAAAAVIPLRVIPNLAEHHKSYHAAISKFSKALDRVFGDGPPDICSGPPDEQLEPRAVAEMVALHLFREGRFKTAARLREDAGLGHVSFQALEAVIELHEVIIAMESKDLGPAQQWVQAHRDQLQQIGSDLDFQLARLQFLYLLEGATDAGANGCNGAVGFNAVLDYAQQHLGKYATAANMAQVQVLMGCLLYAGRLEHSPYSFLVTGDKQLWREATATLYADGCRLLGLPVEGPLSVCYRAALSAVEPLHKMKTVVQSSRGDWDALSELPCEIDLDNSLRFHSIFSCPVSREHASTDNPPMMLKCGHVVCRNSMMRLLKGGQRFKCPTCPMEQSVDETRQLYI